MFLAPQVRTQPEKLSTIPFHLVLGSKQYWNTAHWQNRECHRLYYNFMCDKTKILCEYKQWHQIKDHYPNGPDFCFFYGAQPCKFYQQFKDAFCIFHCQVVNTFLSCSSVFLREPNSMLYIPSLVYYCIASAVQELPVAHCSTLSKRRSSYSVCSLNNYRSLL